MKFYYGNLKASCDYSDCNWLWHHSTMHSLIPSRPTSGILEAARNTVAMFQHPRWDNWYIAVGRWQNWRGRNIWPSYWRSTICSGDDDWNHDLTFLFDMSRSSPLELYFGSSATARLAQPDSPFYPWRGKTRACTYTCDKARTTTASEQMAWVWGLLRITYMTS